MICCGEPVDLKYWPELLWRPVVHVQGNNSKCPSIDFVQFLRIIQMSCISCIDMGQGQNITKTELNGPFVPGHYTQSWPLKGAHRASIAVPSCSRSVPATQHQSNAMHSALGRNEPGLFAELPWRTTIQQCSLPTNRTLMPWHGMAREYLHHWRVYHGLPASKKKSNIKEIQRGLRWDLWDLFHVVEVRKPFFNVTFLRLLSLGSLGSLGTSLNLSYCDCFQCQCHQCHYPANFRWPPAHQWSHWERSAWRGNARSGYILHSKFVSWSLHSWHGYGSKLAGLPTQNDQHAFMFLSIYLVGKQYIRTASLEA